MKAPRWCDTQAYHDAQRAQIATEMLGRGTAALRFANSGMDFRQILLALKREGNLWVE